MKQISDGPKANKFPSLYAQSVPLLSSMGLRSMPPVFGGGFQCCLAGVKLERPIVATQRSPLFDGPVWAY